ncbi:hypothetical protein [Sphaerisporangium fuscum]|uniref:hypothetical protein n=1 Tax=Sphaerisporangium fuscum TaxID=2835868 RepID=UPI001BDCE2EB|nr:hypothetical protein [Sphaerisporangium fuscum]
MTVHRMAAALLAVAAALVAAGCGISPTGVLDGGAPAEGFRPSTRLYFVSGSRLRAVTRPIPWPSLKETLDLLMDGPSAAERARGLRNDLEPEEQGQLKVTSGQAHVRITLSAARPVTRATPVPMPSSVAVPSEAPGGRPVLWMGQLTCTAAGALAARENIDPDAVTVVIEQKVPIRTDSFRCSEFPRG